MSKEVKNLALVFGAVLVLGLVFYKFFYTPEVAVQIATPPVKNISVVSNLAAEHSFSSGPIDAKVTVVEYFDPECETCASVAPYIKNEMQYYQDKVRWVFRYMAYHKNSKTAIHVLEAARKQNLFLEVQHTLFENQKICGEKQISSEKEILEIVAKVKSIKMAQLKKDMLDPKIDEIIAKDSDEGTQAGVNGTPTFFVNGMILEELNLDSLIKNINDRLK